MTSPMPSQNSTAPMGTSRGDAATSLSVRALVGQGQVDSVLSVTLGSDVAPRCRTGSVQGCCSLCFCRARVSVGCGGREVGGHAEPDQGGAWAGVAPAASSACRARVL